MRARMTAHFSGPETSLSIGDEVTGSEAERYVKAGYAEPIVETAVSKKETATRKRTVETR